MRIRVRHCTVVLRYPRQRLHLSGSRLKICKRERLVTKKLPYQARTATGDTFDINFDLHDETEDPVRVHQLLSAVLNNIDKELSVLGTSSNGDVLQALAMAYAIRTRMINGAPQQLKTIALELAATSLDACMRASRQSPPAGHG